MIGRFFWLYTVLILLAGVVIIIPFKRIKQLFVYSFFAGFVFAFVQNYILVNILGWWEFHYVLIPIFNIPLSAMIFWWFSAMFFGYILKNNKIINRVYLFTIFSTLYTVLVEILRWLNYLDFHGFWNAGYTFLQAFFSHVLMHLVYTIMNPQKKR